MTSSGSNFLDSASNDAVQLESFLGEWRDSLGHRVHVAWAPKGELDVQLLKPHSTRVDCRPISLKLKALGQGQFQCGHFELKLDKSSAEKIVWADVNVKGKQSIWERDVHRGRSRSRSQPRRVCGCASTRKVVLRCVEHLPLLPPRSVLHDISTPGAWAPPGNAPEITQRAEELEPVKVEQLLEANDQSLAHASSAEDVLQAANAKLTVKQVEVPDSLTLTKQQILHKGNPNDPRLRRAAAAPTGGA